ncbi:MAG TPA: hypothetical protein VNL74_00205 [Methylococcus sp.]|nr:hypothetical protein [Methylococcus sp.]
MSTQRKGLNSLRTLSGRVNQTFTPYRAYMQITCLEMEKSRRLQEQKSAEARIAGIHARLREIEAEKQNLQQALRKAGAETAVTAREAGAEGKSRSREAHAAESPNRVGFRLKY